MRLSRFSALFIALFSMAVAQAHAQLLTPDLAPGLQAYQSYHGGDVDSISLSNGNVTVRLPLISYPQRGDKLKLSYALVYNGKGYSIQKDCAGGPPCVWWWTEDYVDPFNGAGVLGYFGIVDEQDVQQSARIVLVPTNGWIGGKPYTFMVWDTPDGSSHPGGLASGIPGVSGQLSLDGSGFISGYDYNYACSSKCYTTDSSGIIYYPAGTAGNSQPQRIIREDSNGNQILATNTGSYIDTVGRTIPSLVSGSSTGCTGPLPTYSAYEWQLPGINGSSLPYVFCYAQVPINIPALGSAQGLTGTDIKLQSVVLPNHQTWTFEYSSRNAGDPQSVNYGDLTKITFPTGGTISYTYQLISWSAGNSGSMWVKSRTVDANDGKGPHTWNYAFTMLGYGPCPVPTMTTVTDPLGNDSVHTYSGLPGCSPYETLAQDYQGPASSGNLLKSVQTSYRYVDGSGYFYPQTALSVFPTSKTTTLNGSISSTENFQYCCDVPVATVPVGGTTTVSYGLKSDDQITSYASSGTGPLLREEATTYQFQNNAAYTSANMLSLIASETTLDGTGQVSNTTYNYDESGYLTASNLSSNEFTTTPLQSVRGNVTTTTQWLNGGSSPQSHTNWYDTGEVYQAIDPLLHTTTYAYSSTYADSLPTQITNVLNQSTNLGYDFNTGLKTSATDPNGQTTTYSYNDPLNRLTDVQYPDVFPGTSTHGETKYTYDDTASPVNVVVSETLSPSVSKQTQLDVDGVGRLIHQKLLSDPQGVDETDTTYDGLGRVQSVSNPYRSTSDPTYGITSYAYDALGRKTMQCQPDNGTGSNPCTAGSSYLQWVYTGNVIDSYDETKRHSQRTTDALGRLTKVLEPDGSTNITAAPTVETDYTYNALNDLITVNQHGLTNTLTRTFTYDSLSRLVCSANPEIHVATCPATASSTYTPGTIAYSYDADGNLISKIAPAPNAAANSTSTVTTTYSYDTLNRLKGKSYSDGVTPSAAFTYDQTTDAYGNATGNGIGRLTSESSGSGTTAWSAAYHYDPMGRIAQKRQQWGEYPWAPYMFYQYDLAGNTTIADNGESRRFYYTYDGAGRAISLTAGPASGGIDATLVSTVNYSAVGESYANLGNGSQARRGYDNRMRLNSFRLAVSPSAFNYLDAWNVTYDTNGNVLTGGNQYYPESAWTYTYDNLNRLVTAASLRGTGCQYSYDTYGNRLSQAPYQSGTCAQTTTNYSGNRISTPGYSYDAAGNLTYDSANTYTYDAEGRLSSIHNSTTSVSYQYSPEGQRVGKTLNGVFTNYAYDPSGRLMWTNFGNNTPEDIYFNGRHFGYLYTTSSPTVNVPLSKVIYSTVDWLGSETTRFDASQNMVGGFYHLPFGDGQLTVSGTDDDTLHFTGKERDAESGLDYFGSRYYGSSMGRFMSPDWSEDPDPVPYADLENPQTLNLYGYVTNNPLRLYDPTGHSGCCDVLPTMEEVDAGIAYLEGGLETAATVSAGAVVGTVGLIGSQIFAPAQMGNDPAERRYILMMSKGGRQNHSETDFAHYTDAELDALLKDPTTSKSDREKIVREQKSRATRNAQKRGGGKKKAPAQRNDPASVRARQNAAAAPAVVPTSTEDNSTVTTTQEDHLPQPPKDPQQQ